MVTTITTHKISLLLQLYSPYSFLCHKQDFQINIFLHTLLSYKYVWLVSPQTSPEGMFLFTREHAPTIELFPISIPGNIVELAPIKQLSPTTIFPYRTTSLYFSWFLNTHVTPSCVMNVTPNDISE